MIAESEVRLDPPTVRAGDAYLVLDEPQDGSFVFVQRKRTAEETPGPMTDDDLARLAMGDTQWTASEGISAGGCSQGAGCRGSRPDGLLRQRLDGDADRRHVRSPQ